MIMNLGATPKPCPTVALPEPLPVQVATENPAVALARTLEVMEPCVFVTVEVPASQHQATNVRPLALVSLFDPVVNPSELNEVSVLAE